MPIIDGAYLDSNLLTDYYRRFMEKRPFAYPAIIDFLVDKKDLPKFISSFSLAEIGARISREFPNFTREHLREFTRLLIDAIGLEIIEAPEINWNNVIQFSMMCKDARNSIHIEIARSRNLWFITRDKDDPRVKNLYHKVMGETKFKKQFS